jgi:hypothetical protein
LRGRSNTQAFLAFDHVTNKVAHVTVALILIFLSAATHAVVNVLTKRADDKYAMRLLIGVFSSVLVAPSGS